MVRKDKNPRTAKKAENDGADSNIKKNANGRLDSEALGFQIRTGPDRAKNRTANQDIELPDITMYAGRSELLTNATLKLVYGTKYGLIGRNGVGKSTLLHHLSQRKVPLPAHVFVLHVEQEIEGSDDTVLEAVVKSDLEREWLLAAETELLAIDPSVDPDPKVHGVGLMEVYERLDQLDSENAEVRAAAILTGLGFDFDMQSRATKEYSGGWRMRVALAQALYMNPDLLLLDEPTNHLDIHAITWLEEFLSEWERTVVIVSHDRGFLNSATTATIHLHHKRLVYYGGNYDTFVRVRADHMANQQAVQAQQGRKQEHLKSFIARFGQGHKKMAAQAQSRMKMLKKLQEEAVTVDYDDPYLTIEFPASSELPPPVISVIDTAFGYNPSRTLYADLNFGVDCESRVAIIGPNGAGKSTFLQLLDGSLVPTDGAVRKHSKAVVTRFTQHHIETLNLEEDAISHIRRLGEKEQVTVLEAYRILAVFGLGGELATAPVKVLSGGQKSRLAFAQIAYRKPHILLLDEPTNHLDLETIEGLALAINKFEGGVVLVSHDERLIKMVADELWVVMPGHVDDKTKKWIPGSVQVFNGTFGQYKRQLKAEFLKKKLLKTKAAAPAAPAPVVKTATGKR